MIKRWQIETTRRHSVAAKYTIHVLCYKLSPSGDENVPVLRPGLLFGASGDIQTVIALIDSSAYQREQAADAYAFDKRRG